VLVTGGASGIGAAIASRFAEAGARIAVLDADANALEDIRRNTPAVEMGLLTDVADRGSVDNAFGELDRAWGGVDILFNSAGISVCEPFVDASFEQWQRVLAVNLTGSFLVAQRAARRMVANARGVIVNIASVSGIVGMPNYVSYNVSKAGVIELTKTLALELAPAVRVNAIAPGYVQTPMQKAEHTPEMLRELASKLPLGRLAKPAEIAALGAYLASSEAQFITGQIFVIDGGETAGGLASR
jgi:NAD(P)-dependent dehydrogenase (short-subunit alcohol dehydrogenase family)